MDTSTENSVAREELRIAIETRALEINLVWQRSLFFWGFIVSAAVGYSQAFGRSHVVAALLASFGLLCSLCWAFVNRGSKFWQQNWEIKANAAASKVFGNAYFQDIRAHDGSRWLGPRRFSVTDLVTFVSDLTTGLWSLALLNEVGRGVGWRIEPEIEAIAVMAILVLTGIFVRLAYTVSRRPTPAEGTETPHA